MTGVPSDLFNENAIDPRVIRTVKRSIANMPGMSGTFNATLSLLSNPSTNVKIIAQAVERDQVLAARVLRLVNSPFFGLERQVTGIRQAVILLGFNTIRQLIWSFGINKTVIELSSKYQFDMDQFWNHSISTAVLGRRISNSIPGSDSESAFAAGLLHDIGKMVLYMAFKDTYHNVHREAQTSFTDLCTLEKEKIGITHPQAGYILGLKWNFPQQILNCILFHHNVPPASDTTSLVKLLEPDQYNLLEITSLSNVVSSYIGFGLGTPTDSEIYWSKVTISVHCPEYAPPRNESIAFLKQEIEEIQKTFIQQ
ncbi:MAG: HDOD domain-containing protein [Deltaproteobacteria bacterium]|nr:HDOD domain-containing protein [Deltaproteobacteria bacterium]